MNITRIAVLSDESTVNELLNAINERLAADPSVSDHARREIMSHFGWAANVVARSLKVSRASLTIRQLISCEATFKGHVARQPISDSAKVMLPCYRNGMIREARAMGWCPSAFALEIHWERAIRAVQHVPAGRSIIEDAIGCQLRMDQFSDASLEGWGEKQRRDGCSKRYVISRKSAFRGAIRRAGLEASFPLLTTSIAATIRMGARDLHGSLRSELATVIRGMRIQARREGRRFPYSSARKLVERVRDFAGYAAKFHGLSATCMEQLLSEPLVRAYIQFLLEERDWKRASILSSLNRIRNAMRWHPLLRSRDLTWIKKCVLEWQEDDDTDIDPTSTGKEVLREDLVEIIGKIAAERKRLKGKYPRQEAWLALKEFIIFWLVTHPWPSRCLTSCRINGPDKNLFQAPVKQGESRATLFTWIRMAVRKNPRLRFWRFYFSPAYLQLGSVAHGFLVRPLVRKMRDYLKFRKVLVKGKPDPSTLLVNFAGQAFECSEFSKLVGDICEEYLGIRVSPSMFRRIFLFDWLAEYPGEEEKVAAILFMNAASVSELLERSNLNPQSRRGGSSRAWVRRSRTYWR